jgi:hypothetical protein
METPKSVSCFYPPDRRPEGAKSAGPPSPRLAKGGGLHASPTVGHRSRVAPGWVAHSTRSRQDVSRLDPGTWPAILQAPPAALSTVSCRALVCSRRSVIEPDGETRSAYKTPLGLDKCVFLGTVWGVIEPRSERALAASSPGVSGALFLSLTALPT